MTLLSRCRRLLYPFTHVQIFIIWDKNAGSRQSKSKTSRCPFCGETQINLKAHASLVQKLTVKKLKP